MNSMLRKKTKKPRNYSVIVAEDVRIEQNGQQSIIGVFGNQIKTTDLQLILPKIVFRVDFLPDAAQKTTCELIVLTPSRKVIFAMPKPTELVLQSQVPHNCIFSWSPAFFDESGTYEVHFGVGEQPKKIHTFQVNLGQQHQDRVGTPTLAKARAG